MIENKIKSIEQTIYYKKMLNGLSVYLVPDAKKNSYYVNLVTFYGSNDLEYETSNGKLCIDQPGLAHYLEHKVFEMPDGSDPFAFFSQSGTDVNAGTSYYSTKYYMWGSNNFIKNLDYFISMVMTPNFTNENIIKERGIIAEEIKMYDDDPSWQIENVCRKNLFHNWHVREKIAGTINSIFKINKEMLDSAYNTFYQPNNMAIAISGNFNLEETLNLIENHPSINNKNNNIEFTKKQIKEPETVYKEYQLLKGNIVIPKLRYSFKIKNDILDKQDTLKTNMYLNCIFSCLFGSTSDFYERIYQEDLTTGYYYDHNNYGNYYILNIEAESDKADLFKEMVDNTLENIFVSYDELERYKKMLIATEIRISERIDVMVNGIIDDLVVYGKPHYNRIEVIKSLNCEELNNVIKKLDISNNTFILMIPKDK